MNYTIFTREQVIPKILPSGAVNYGPQPVYPEGASLVYRPATQNIWADDPLLRNELISDPNGKATVADVDKQVAGFRDWKASSIRLEGERRLKTLVGHYLPAERETWPYQREEALRWKEGGMQQTPYCDAIAAGRGVPREVFMQAVLDNTALFSQYSAMFLGQQQAILDRIYAATTVDGVLSEQWPQVSP